MAQTRFEAEAAAAAEKKQSESINYDWEISI